MAVAGLYRRILPSPPAVDFASSEGKVPSFALKLFSEALQNGTMEGFFKLISHFQTQSEPAYCGLASLSMVFNALAIDPGRRWKGPWRWYDESMLDCCEPLEKIKAEGITFGKVACVAQCAGAKVETFHTNQSSLSDFRNHLIRCASSEDRHLIASYHRKHFEQTGTGHFSPIGGYHAGSDMALILDVARFKYPPHWVPLPLLWRAMDTIDEISGRPRGFMLVSSLQKEPSSLLYTISPRDESWVSMARYLIDDVPNLLKSEGLKSVPEVLSFLFNNLPTNAKDLIKWVVEVRKQEDESTISQEEKGRLAMKEEILRQVRQTELFKIAMDIASSAARCSTFLSIRSRESLSNIASNACCRGAALLSGGLTTTTGFCCRATSVKCLRANCDKPMTVVSGTLVSSGNDQRVYPLIPVSAATSGSCRPNNCALVHPESTDVLTVLLLALPHSTWYNLKDESLLTEIRRLVSPENLPGILREEVLHLRQQLHLLKKFKDKEEEDDPGAH